MGRGLSFGVMIVLFGCGGGGGSDPSTKSEAEVPVAEDILYDISHDENSVLSSVQDRVLFIHNQKRNLHFTDANLSYSMELERVAQDYADTLAKSGNFEHDPNNHNNGYGENLYAYSKNQPLGIDDAMSHWYEEEEALYNYDDGSCREEYYDDGTRIKCGHYTQVVWQETHEVGCATAQYSRGEMSGGYIYVCKYKKAGNIEGQKPYCAYSNADIYSTKLPEKISLANKSFRIELRKEDRVACTKEDYFNSSILFSADLKSAVVEDFEMLALTYNDSLAKNRLEFDHVVIEGNVIKLQGTNKNIPATSYQNKKIYMNISIIGEAALYYAVEIEWNVLDSSNPLYRRKMKAKLHTN